MLTPASVGRKETINLKRIRHSPAQIVEKLRIAEIEQAGGLTIGQVCQ